jgi:acetolactate synthase-1/2/3 large subunit
VAESTGARIVAETLHHLGVKTIFTVSGNQILQLIDALPDVGIRIVHMRHETAAAYAAAGYAEISGTPGVVLTSAGPAFLASLQGIGIANSMELPLLFLSGASPLRQRGMGAFQDLDQITIASSVCKASSEIESVERAAPTIAHAFRLAAAGIPGVVHVAMPADVLTGTSARPLPAGDATPPLRLSVEQRTTLGQMAQRLATAQRPAIIARPAAARGQAATALDTLAATLGVVPLVAESPRGFSDLKYEEIVPLLAESDCLLVVAPADFVVAFLDGSTMPSESNILLIDAPTDPDPQIEPNVRVQAPPDMAIGWLAQQTQRTTPVDPQWSSRMTISRPPAGDEDDEHGAHPQSAAMVIRGRLESEDIVVLDGGEFCQWVRLALRDLPNRVLWNGKLGAIGGSIPMAIGAKVADPSRRVVAALGDGSAGYHLSEFETAFREGVQFVAIVGNDELWGVEWHMQVERYGIDRAFSTALSPARYDVAAAGFGAAGYDLDYLSDLDAALSRAMATDLPVCINLHILPDRSPAILNH